MPIQWQNVEIQISGVDQYTDAPHVVNGRLEIAENIRFLTPPTVARRLPFEGIGHQTGSGGAVETPVAMVGHDAELLSVGTRRLYAFAETPNRWQERGTVSDFHVTRQPLMFDQSRNITNADYAVNNRFCGVLMPMRI